VRECLQYAGAFTVCESGGISFPSMRIRTIKPEFWAHPVLSKAEDTVRLAAIGLLNIADDEGYFLATAPAIRSALWPFDESSTKARRALATLTAMGYVRLCEHPTHGTVGQVINFTKHQRIDRPSDSKIKAYWFDESSTSPRRILDEPSLLEQGTGNREQVSRELGNRVVVPFEKSGLQIRIEAIFNRRTNTPLSATEAKAWKAALPSIESASPDDLATLEKFYAAKESKDNPLYRRTSLATLLNNWSGEMDKARTWMAGQSRFADAF